MNPISKIKTLVMRRRVKAWLYARLSASGGMTAR
jgi:hypothetical protein